jgi:hypothetical protein
MREKKCTFAKKKNVNVHMSEKKRSFFEVRKATEGGDKKGHTSELLFSDELYN